MKRIIRFLFVLMFLMISITYVRAEDDDLSPTSQGQIETQKSAIDKYCSENEKITGCIYDKSSNLYSGTKEVDYAFWWPANKINIAQYFKVPSGVTLTRGYQTFDGNGNAVFAGCYRFNTTIDVKVKSSNSFWATFDKTEKVNTTVFVFQIVTGTGNNCKVTKSFVVPSKGLKKSFDKGTYSGQEFAHNESFGIQHTLATLNGWVAEENGDCPKVFGYTANTRWYTSDKNKYIFSNNASDFNIDTISFFGGEAYKTRPGCTVEDVDGKAKAQELLDKVLKEINGRSCPAKIEEMESFSDNLEKWYENIRKNNEYRVLWSAGLVDEVTKKSAEVQISEAIHNKISDCQYKICKVSDTQRRTVEANLGADCKNGCTLTNVRTPSESENAKCYCCGGSQGCTYAWMENGGSSCSLQSSVSKDQCIGTTKDLACRRCLINAYDKANLTDEQKSCMAGNEIAKLLTEKNLENANEDAADKDVEKEIEENRQLREDIYKRLGTSGITFDFKIPEGNISTCKELMGENLSAIIKVAITVIQIVAAIIAIVKGMMVLIPPILAKDADALKKAGSTLAKMAIILVIIFLFKPLLTFLGDLLDFDTSCIL